MYEPVWRSVVSGAYLSQPARLTGFRRHAIRNESYPALVRSPDLASPIDGRLYRDIGAEDLARLDRFEGGQYQRVACQVTGLAESIPRQDSAESAAQPIAAQVYLFLRPECLLPDDWDEHWFRTQGIERFLRTYCPKP